jgi:hypothetical protein
MADAGQILIGASGNVFVAPTGTAAPTDMDTALNAAFVNLGFVTEDGVTFRESKEITSIGAWQSSFPVRHFVTTRDVEVAFALREWSKETVEFATGGTVSTAGASDYKLVPDSSSDLDVLSLVIEWTDGTRKYRLYVPEGIVSETIETQLVRTAAADLPVTFKGLYNGSAEVYTLFTDDPSFA